MKAIVVAVCLLIVLPAELEARFCYVCGPVSTPGECGANYVPKTAHRTDCGAGQQCMKFGAGDAVSRSCSSNCIPAALGSIGGNYCCDTDDCNSGTNVSASLLLLLLPLIAAFLKRAF